MKLKELKQGDRFTLTGTLTQTHKYWAEEGIEEATLLGKDTNGEFNYWAKTPAGDYEIYLEDSSDIDVIKVTTTVEAAKAESYLQRQAEWVEKNGIKPGAKLKVTRAAKSREDGWMNSWTRTMDGFVGGEVEFRRDAGPIGIACNGIAYDFPYFVLEPVPVKPPEPPYADRQDDEPLRNGDLRIDGCDPKPRQWLPTDGFTITAGEFKRRYDGLKALAIARKIESYKPYTLEDSLLGMWVLNKTSKSKYIICAMSTMGVNLPGIGFILYEVLLRDYTFTDGSPCGK